ESDATILRNVGRLGGHGRLHLDRAAHGIDYTGELQQQSVARGLDDTTAVGSYGRVHDFLPNDFQRRQRAALVAAHPPRVARGVARDEGGTAPLLGNSVSPASRAPSSRYS